MRTEGIIVGWHDASETGYIRSGLHAEPHLFRARDLRSDCPSPQIGMAVQFEAVLPPGQTPRALAVGPASRLTPLMTPPAPVPRAPDGAPLPSLSELAARSQARRARHLRTERLWRVSLSLALLVFAGTGWWLWTHPLS